MFEDHIDRFGDCDGAWPQSLTMQVHSQIYPQEAEGEGDRLEPSVEEYL